jgi:hypothetical protein
MNLAEAKKKMTERKPTPFRNLYYAFMRQFHSRWFVILCRPWRRGLQPLIQRAIHGVAYEDCWALDEYIAKVMTRGLQILADESCGYPGYKTEESWDEELRRASKAFKSYAERWKEGGMDDEDHELVTKHFENRKRPNGIYKTEEEWGPFPKGPIRLEYEWAKAWLAENLDSLWW